MRRPPGFPARTGLVGARANYDKNSSQELIYHIATYLNAPEPSGKMVIPKVFVCPGFARFASGGLAGLKLWLLNDDIDPEPCEPGLPVRLPGAAFRVQADQADRA